MMPDPSEHRPAQGPRGLGEERHPVLLAADALVPLAVDATRVRRVADQAGDDEHGALLDVSEALGLGAADLAGGFCDLLAEVSGGWRRLRMPGRVVVRHVPLTDFRSVPAFLARHAARRGIVGFFLLDERVGVLVDAERLWAAAGGEGAA